MESFSEIAQFVTEPGTGPRHLVFHPTKSLAYLFGELDSTVSVLSYDETDGSFTELQKFLLYLLIMMRLMVVLRFVFLLMAVSFMLQTVAITQLLSMLFQKMAKRLNEFN